DRVLAAMAAAAAGADAVAPPAKAAPAGSIVPDHRRRILLCQGRPCHNAGAAVLWGHYRAAQARLDLRRLGVMAARTSCLGPCNLAPVVQIYPEGTFYGGVDEAGLDRIAEEHLVDGRVVDDLAYRPAPGKQTLRR